MLISIVVAAVHAASPTPLPVTVPGSGIFQSSLLLSIVVWAPVLVSPASSLFCRTLAGVSIS